MLQRRTAQDTFARVANLELADAPIVRSVLAVVAGYASMAAVVIALSVILKKAAPKWVGSAGSPNAMYVVTNLIYSLAAAVLGGYIAAAIGSRAPLAHACALAGIVFLLAIVSMVQMGDKQPRWYQVALIIVGTAGTIVGGLLRARA